MIKRYRAATNRKNMSKNIFVIGLDDFNYTKLRTLRNIKEYEFHPLFSLEDVQGPKSQPLDRLLEKGEKILRDFPGSVDAIVGYWDFPVSEMVPFLCNKLNLPSASLESTTKCEHKIWSRIEQSKVIKDHIPRFQAVNPFNDDEIKKIELDYPYWIKPVKATDSQLAFKVKKPQDLDRAISIIREKIPIFAEPFNYILSAIQLPDEIANIDGSHCIAEEAVSGRQCTIEGYVYNGKPHVYGVIDSLRYPNISSFFRYQYPSSLPVGIKKKMAWIGEKVVTAIGLDHSAFNIEFFINEAKGTLHLLEINPRISQSHADLFEKVDGASNHEIMVAMALGEKPEFPSRQGNFDCAAKFYFRAFKDGVVTHVPTQDKIKKAQDRFPGTLINILVKEGDRLSGLHGQDSYSYRVALIYMGAKNTRELLKNYNDFLELLSFRFSPPEP